MRNILKNSREKIGTTATTSVLMVAIIFMFSATSPAFGGPSLLSLQRSVTKAVKLATSADARSKRADVRSKKALAFARLPGPRGPAGPVGPAGTPGSTSGTSGATVIDFRADPGASSVVYNRGGLVLTASCAAGPNITVLARTTVDHAILHVANIIKLTATTTTTEAVQDNDFLIAGTPKPLVSKGHLQGSATYSTPTGGVITLTYGAEQGAFGSPQRGCWFGGTASSG